MTWEQKLAALNAIADHALIMRSPGDWYVSARIEIGGRGLLVGAFGNGKSPQDAVEDHWRQLVDEIDENGDYLIGGNPGHTKVVRWNGFMWADASHLRKAAPAA